MISKNELMSAYRSKEPADSSQGHAQEQSTISRFYIHDRWRPTIFLLELHRSKENLFIRHIWTPLEKKKWHARNAFLRFSRGRGENSSNNFSSHRFSVQSAVSKPLKLCRKLRV